VEVEALRLVEGLISGVASPFDEVTLSMEVFGSCRGICLGRASGEGETSSSISISRSVSVASPSVAGGVKGSSSACGTESLDNCGLLELEMLRLCPETIGVRFAIALRCPYRRSISAGKLKDKI